MGSMFPHEITIFNKVDNGDSAYYLPTIIRNALYTSKDKLIVSHEGKIVESETLVVIPFNYKADKGKKFTNPRNFSKVTDIKRDKLFTLASSDLIAKCFATEDKRYTLKEIKEITSDYIVVTKVETYDFGLKHWNVSGK